MTGDRDGYEAYYADKLWNLLPAVYRAQDTDQFAAAGPLRELVDRIGAQAAVVRRSLDRLWEDQSIETCDDWVIPYLGDLLATNLVTHLDARGRRLDVAKTIRYRRRKGTLAVLEEIAADITGWDARAVEFFRRLGRTRHGLDPALPRPGDTPDAAEGLVGPLTRTGIGGLADLRNVYGAGRAATAFDEFFHTADFRPGRGRRGWYGIPKLGVFLWRLRTFGVGPTTPVPVKDCPGWFTFDPTGRDVPVFTAGRSADDYGEGWVSPTESQVRTPISRQLFESQYPPQPHPSMSFSQPENRDALGPKFPLYPDSLAVYTTPTPTDDTQLLDAAGLRVRPERGRFFAAPADAPQAWATYHYGFSSRMGAGPYDRRIGRAPPPAPAPESIRTGGGNALAAGVPSSGTLTLDDSLTYDAAADVAVTGALTIRAGDRQRPVLRLSSPWALAGAGTGNALVLDGLLVSGADVVLRGAFDRVTVTCCTLDPGVAAPPGAADIHALAADGRVLVPCRLWVEGEVRELIVERSVTGSIRTRPGGRVEELTVTDSIVQSIPTADVLHAAVALTDGDVTLTRCTVLGPAAVHRLRASECILRDRVEVDDTQHGCVRFSAWADGSRLPRQYRSARVAAGVAIFTATDFGRPGFCQLLPTADAAILPTVPPPPVPPTILAGAEDGSEMGAFAGEKNPIKERGLLIKYAEYMPAGLMPVLVYVT